MLETMFLRSEYIEKMWGFTIICFLIMVAMRLDIYLKERDND